MIEQRRVSYAGLRPQASPAGRAAIVVDDGVATGMTMQVALRSVRSLGPSRLVAAVPVASEDAFKMLQTEADEVVCLSVPRQFLSVGSFHRTFEQVSDAEVERLLRQGGEMTSP